MINETQNAKLDSVWSTLNHPTGDKINARQFGSDIVWLGIDQSQSRHLLILLSDPSSAKSAEFHSHGITAKTKDLILDDSIKRSYFDITCKNNVDTKFFTCVVADLMQRNLSDPNSRLNIILNVLKSWKWFWGVDKDLFSLEDSLGLFGELVFLSRWLSPAKAMNYWMGPYADRHDFVSTEASVEVKTSRTSGDGHVRHKISSLDQLSDPETGTLYLYSLQVVKDRLASDSLISLTSEIEMTLENDTSLLLLFRELLAMRNYTPLARIATNTYRIVGESLYQVKDGFPRLTHDIVDKFIVPNGVVNITYELETAACEAYKIASTPDQLPKKIFSDLL